jgi:hypothetical protein
MKSVPRRTRGLTSALMACATFVAGLAFVAPALATQGLGVTGTFGSPGAGSGELSLVAPRTFENSNDSGSGVAISSSGDVYVADTGNDRVEWFDSAGKYEGQFNGLEVDGAPVDKDEAATEKLVEPEAIAVDNDPSSPSFGDVYVSERGKGVVDKFTAIGDFLSELSVEGSHGIHGIAVDASGDVWIVKTETAVQEFSDAAKNEPLGSPLAVGYADDGIAIDSEDNLYVMRYKIVQKYSDAGTYLGEVCNECARGIAIDPATNDLLVDHQGTSIARYGPFGEPFEAPIDVSKPNSLANGAGLAVSPTNHEVYVADAGSNEIVAFTLGDGPETPETLPASGETGKAAVLHGKLNPHGEKGEVKYHFAYSTEGTCTGAANAGTAPVSPATLAEAKDALVQVEATKLEPNAKYTYCLVSENNFAVAAGAEASFETRAAPPEVVSESTKPIAEDESEVKFSAVIDPEHSKQETTYYFEYATEATGEALEGEVETAAGEGAIAAGTFGDQEVSSAPASVPPKDTRYYRVVTTNGTGEPVKGKVEAYTKLPIVDSETTSTLTLTEATLRAEINPDFRNTEYYFEYASGTPAGKQLLEEGKGTRIPGGNTSADVNEFEEIPVDVAARGLTSRTPYYYRAVLENAVSKYTGNVNTGKPIGGEIESFTTESVPLVNTGAAANITYTGATLEGVVTPIDQEATYYFQYISEAGYRAALEGGAEERADPFVVAETTTPVSLAVNDAPQAVGPAPVGGLLSEETYHYRLVAKNEWGVEYGEPHTFRTAAEVLPFVSTGGASGVSQNSATLAGTVGTNSLQTNYGFEISAEPFQPGVNVPATGLGSIGGAATEEVHVTLDELQPGTTYYYRITASNTDGTSDGEAGTFTTPGFPIGLMTPAAPLAVGVPDVAFPTGSQENTGTVTKTLTNKQKLSKALKGCKRDKSKSKRGKCEKAAEKKYGTGKKKRK